MRLLLTGAAGFVGAHLLARLVRGGEHEVAVVLRNRNPPWRIAHLLDRVEVIAGDVGRPAELAGSVQGFAPDVIVHLAWGSVATRDRDPLAQVTETRRTLDLVELAHASGVRHFVGLGSQAEYGPCASRIDEQTPARPVTAYGVAKLCAGLLSQQACAALGLRCAWIRLFSAYGPMDAPTTLISSVCQALLAGSRPALTLGAQQWDYLYVEDAAEAILRVAEASTAVGTYNLGSGRTVTIRDVVERVRDLVSPGAPLGFGEVPYHPDSIHHLEAGIERLQRDTGWQPTTDLETGLRRTVEWIRTAGKPS